jgi:tetratricopeptide (TPR) repeat protein
MGIFDKIKKWGSNEPTDPISQADELEKKGDYQAAIEKYREVINTIYQGKAPDHYRHLTKKIIDCYIKLGDYQQVMDLWELKYHPADYTPKEIYELIKVLEGAGRNDLIMNVYEKAGKKLALNKIEFLMKNKQIPQANAEMAQLLASVPEDNPTIENLWLTKAKLSMSLMKWEEAHRYLSKIIEKNPRNEEARKLKEFCMKQIRN